MAYLLTEVLPLWYWSVSTGLWLRGHIICRL